MLNWLVIGVGDITTKRVLPAIQTEPRSALVGIVSRNPKKAEPYGVSCWTELSLALSQSSADAVYVASPVFLHGPQTVACLRAGRHVLCEKPVAMNYIEAFSMVQAAKEADRILGIAYYRRMYPKVNRAKELMAAGVIGQPVFAEATSHTWLESLNADREWLTDPQRAGGGPLYDNGSHRIDLMNYLFGVPRLVTGQLSTVVLAIQVEDNATVLIDYENGVRAQVDVRWHSRVSRDEFRIRGTDDEIDLSPLNASSLVHPGGLEDLPPHPNLHYPCIEDFVKSVLDSAPLRSSGESAILTDWVTERVRR
jgi:1,5-anhydro-D-fructose reductase (1,5-anhydro-D-mannitol-forming)